MYSAQHSDTMNNVLWSNITRTCDVYSYTLQCVVFYLSQRRTNSYKLLCDAIFWANLHLTEEYIVTDAPNIRWLLVDVNEATVTVPPSTPI